MKTKWGTIPVLWLAVAGAFVVGLVLGGYYVAQKSGGPSVPYISGMVPSSGLAGTMVTLTGSGFEGFGEATYLGISESGQKEFLPLTVSSTMVTFVVPEGLTPGIHKVSVFVGAKFTPTSNPVDFTVIPNQLSQSDWKTYTNPEFGITFQYPAKYVSTPFPKGSEGLLPLFQYKDPAKTMPDFLDVRWLPFKSTDSSEQVLMKDVVFDGSGAHPTSFDSFTLVHLGDNDFYKIRTGLFEGVLGYRYYLIRDSGAFVFVLTSNNVPWTDPTYNADKDPRNLELLEMLKTVKLNI